jgi:3-hydroxyisobutyrate dehydrogenase
VTDDEETHGMADTDKLTVAVLGTGIMGAAMGLSLARVGHTVRAWNRTRAKAAPLTADDAHIAGSPEEAVRGADAVLTMLYDDGAALEVMREAVPGLRSGTVWAQSTTVGIDFLARSSERPERWARPGSPAGRRRLRRS